MTLIPRPFLGIPRAGGCLLALALASPLAAKAADTQGGAAAAQSGAEDVYQTPQSPYQSNRFPSAAGRFYADAWGIDTLSVRLMESGELIRFTYRVIDPTRAAPLLDKRLTPALVDETRGVSLVVPQMESIGNLRQTQAAKENRLYWVAFSNKRLVVRKGDRVNVVIGPFHANNLVVD